MPQPSEVRVARARQRPWTGLSDGSQAWSDEQLVAACLKGDQHAWAGLLGRYKTLIYAVARRYGASSDDAGDVLQLVATQLFKTLPQLREAGRVRGWLITAAAHHTIRWQERRRTRDRREGVSLEAASGEPISVEPDVLEELERDHIVREALATLSPRCRRLIHLLFYRDPPVLYRQLAKQLGLATGSIGFIRGRCLQRLKRALDEKVVRW